MSEDESSAFFAQVPDWVSEQQVSDVFHLAMSLNADFNASESIETLATVVPAPISILLNDSAKLRGNMTAYSVIGCFPSGAVRTIGDASLSEDGCAEFNPYGYWSLIDPEASDADFQGSGGFGLQLDFVVIEVA